MHNRLRSSALVLSLATALPAHADGGTLEFQGQIVEAGCNVTATPSTAGDIPLATGITLHISAENDACSRGYTAFTSDYAPLQSTDTDADGKVITLTYN